ncbi:MAG: cyclic nucleotide-binding domain-containing protein [Chloroflexota bacterium]
MTLKRLLQGVALFSDLDEDRLQKIVDISQIRDCSGGEIIVAKGAVGEELFLVLDGEVSIRTSDDPSTAFVFLGRGQIIGEMALVDSGYRSATVQAVSPTELVVFQKDDIYRLCEEDPQLGYYIMRNLAADLSFKLRHRHLTAQADQR